MWATVPGPPVAPDSGRDHLGAQGRRLGVCCGGPPGGGAPSVRESAARGRDLSEVTFVPHSAAALYHFVWLTGLGRTVRRVFHSLKY